jgi:hypothetical protein
MKQELLIICIASLLLGSGFISLVDARVLKKKISASKALDFEQVVVNDIDENLQDVVIWDNFTEPKVRVRGSPFLPCIVTVKVVADEEYRLRHPRWRTTVANVIKNSVIRLGTLKMDCFLKYGIILVPLLFVPWRSDNSKDIMGLFYDVLKIPLSGCDILVALTGQCSPHGIVGVAAPGFYRCINTDMDRKSDPLTPHFRMLTDNLVQHEVSHLFGVHGDHPPGSGIKCVMSHGFGLKYNKWCPICAAELVRGKNRF